MSLQGYRFDYHGTGRKNDCSLRKEHIYSFRTRFKIEYIVNVEEYENDMYVVKYFQKSHSNSKNKYNLLINKKLPCFNDARRVIFTCVEIGKHIYATNPNASFGFMGNQTLKERERKITENTKRFRVYRYFANFYFSPDNFQHIMLKSRSIFILLNRKNEMANKKLFDDITKMFSNMYNMEDIINGIDR
jgi:hypothetical protein